MFVFANIINNIITVDRDSLRNLLTDKRRPTYELCVRPTLTTAGGLYMYVCFYDGRQQISLDNRRSSSLPPLVCGSVWFDPPVQTRSQQYGATCYKSTATMADYHKCAVRYITACGPRICDVNNTFFHHKRFYPPLPLKSLFVCLPTTLLA